jgi:hypothetical protein
MLCHPEAQSAFPASLSNGKRHVIVALPSDTYGAILRRVKSFRGPVNVAVDADAGIEVIAFYPSEAMTDGDDVDGCEVGEKSELGLLIALLRRTRRVTRVRLVQPKYDAELVDRETPALAES